MSNLCRSPRRRGGALCLVAACAMNAVAGWARAQSHPEGVPQLASRPGAQYTIYLDFAGFSFTGGWGGNGNAAPGVTPAYDNATSNFSAADQSDIENIWARVAAKYSAFNINVTTIDPAVSAGQAGSDFYRQGFYDNTSDLMHTVVGGNGSWIGGGGISYVGLDQYGFAPTSSVNSGAGIGYHTNWVFPDQLGGAAALQNIGEASSHENGHGLGLNHHSDFNGTTLVTEYSSNNSATGNGSVAPIMGVSYYSQRGVFTSGPSDSGNGVYAPENDVQVIESNSNMGNLVDDGISHVLSSATPFPMSGSLLNYTQARGVIEPASSTSPNPVGAANYTSDYFTFNSTGGSVSLTVHDGGERITPGVADAGATLSSTLSILNSSGGVLYTASTDYSTLTESITQSLPAGKYYAQVSSTGGQSGSYGGNTSNFYDMGDFFITGSGITGAVSNNYYWTGGGTSSKWSQVDSGSFSNFRTDHANGSYPSVGVSAGTNVFFTADSASGNLVTTLGAATTINSLNFTGAGTTAAGTSVTIAADGNTLSISALQGYLDANGTAYPVGTGLVVQAGSAAQSIAVPVVLLNSQTWQINNSAASPLTVSGVISGSNQSLTVTGVGKLILTGNNSYTGGTTVVSGTVAFGSGSLGGGNITLKNGAELQYVSGNTQDVTTGRTFIISGGGQVDTNGNNVTWAGSITGADAGYFTKLGSGTLTLTGLSNPSDLFVRGGIVALSGSANLTTAASPVNSTNYYSSIGQSSGDSGTLTLTGGAAFVSAGDLNVADVSATGVLNVQNNATVSVRTLSVGKYGTSVGTVNQSGGAVMEADNGAGPADWRLGGYGSGSDSAATGTYILTGGTFNTGSANLQVGAYGSGTFKQTGGTASVGSYLSIGRFSGSHGVWDMSSGNGTLTATQQPIAIVGEQGSGSLRVGGSSFITVTGLRIGYSNGGVGTVDQTAGGDIIASGGVEFGGGNSVGGSVSSGTYNLSGGFLITSSISQQPGVNVSGTLNLNGGIIRSSKTGVSLLNGITAANVQAGGAIIDSNGNSVSIDQNLVHAPSLGAVPDGGLTKNGTGVVAITAAATYTGPTTITAGTLRLQGQAAMPIANPIAWFDASDSSTVTTVSGVVTAWANKGTAGSSMNAGQTVAGTGPAVTAPSATGGRTVLTFNNSSSGLVTASNLGISGSQDRTLFVVGDRGAGSMFFAHEGPIGSNNLAYGISSETGNSYLYTWGNDVTLGTQPSGQFEILDSELSSGGTALSGDLISGANLVSGNKTVAANTTASPLYLGDRPTNTATGDVAEVIEYDGALTAAERTAVENYLNYKWFGITPVVANLLPTTTSMNLSSSIAVLDLNSINQTVGSLSGVAGSQITLGSATLTAGNSTSTTFAGNISGAGNFTVAGTGTITIAGVNAFAGITTVSTGAAAVITNAGALPAGGALNISGALTFQPAVTGGILLRNEGAISLNAGAKLNVSAAAVHSNRTLLKAASITVAGGTNAWTGTIDLGNNDVDIQNGTLSVVTNQIKEGFAGGAWTGGGITSSAAAGNGTHLTALGVIVNNNIYGTGSGSLGLFDGVSPAAADILIKYTYYGDSNLDGEVDGSDYTLIDNGYNNNLTGWYNGDFNYDGKVDGSDYTLIDNAFNVQGGNLDSTAEIAAVTAEPAGSTAVPEPAAIGMLAMSIPALIRRVRRKSAAGQKLM